MNLTHIAWPDSVLRCNEALNRLQPGAELIITVCDPGVVASILMLIKSQTDLRFQQFRQSASIRIVVHRVGRSDGVGANPS